MKTLIRFLLCLLLSAKALTVIAYGQSSSTQQRHLGPLGISSRSTSTKTPIPYHGLKVLTNANSLDAFITSLMSAYDIPGLAACIVNKDSIVWQGYYGYADISNNKPVTDSTIFLTCSISKTIMVTALMQLYQQGKFKLDDSINAYLPFPVRNPYFPAIPITFRMLLTHTSSIMDNLNITPYTQLGDYPMPLGTYLQNYFTPGGEYYNPPLNFHGYAPGTAFDYSNVGGSLAGYLVEVISGMPFDQYCKDSVFVPLQMSHTAWFLRDLDTTLIARPYTYHLGNYIDNGLFGFPFYPAGQLRTTATSLARFLMANIKGGELKGVRILDSATVRMMRTVYVVSPPGWSYSWGLIWMKEELTGQGLWGHIGGYYGALTDMFLSEADSTGFIVLMNTDCDQFNDSQINNLDLTLFDFLIHEADILSGVAYASNVLVTPPMPRKQLDTVHILATVENPKNHTLKVTATVSDLVSRKMLDSLSLFNGGLTVDSLWGGAFVAPSTEGVYGVSVRTDDTVAATSRTLPNAGLFTTAGPVKYAGMQIVRSVPTPGSDLYINIGLENIGTTAVIPAVTGYVTAIDSGDIASQTPLSWGSISPDTVVYSNLSIIQFWSGRHIGSTASFALDIYSEGVEFWRDTMRILLTGVEATKNLLPASYSLEQNYPNPFNPSTTISYGLPAQSHVRLQVYNLLGQVVADLLNTNQAAGWKQVVWNANVASGLYFYRLEAVSVTDGKRFVDVKKMILLK